MNIALDWADFLFPLDLAGIAMAAVLGIVVGFRLRQISTRLTATRTFWQIADGAVFFVPLAMLRAFEGSTTWERLLATLPLWIVYILAMRLGNSFEWDRLPGNGSPRRPMSERRMGLTSDYSGPRRRKSDR